MSKPGMGLNTFHLVFIEKLFGDSDEGNCSRNQSEVVENKVNFAEEIEICLFHQKDKVTQILDGKKKTSKEILK